VIVDKLRIPQYTVEMCCRES